jgi:hypothetical protein
MLFSIYILKCVSLTSPLNNSRYAGMSLCFSPPAQIPSIPLNLVEFSHSLDSYLPARDFSFRETDTAGQLRAAVAQFIDASGETRSELVRLILLRGDAAEVC